MNLLFDHREQAPARRKPHVSASRRAPTSEILALVGNRAFAQMLARIDAVPGPAGAVHPTLRKWLAYRSDQAAVPAVQLQKAKGPLEALQKRYRIIVESGDKLLVTQRPQGPRMGSREAPEAGAGGHQGLSLPALDHPPEERAKRDPTYKESSRGECGLHEPDITTGTFKISMYDACFYDITRTVGDKIVGKTAEDPPSGGALELLDELGHAIALREHRVLYQQYLDALKAENDYAAKFRGVTMSEGQLAKVHARHKASGGSTAAAKQRWKDSIGRAERVLGKRRARPAEAGTPKPGISEYSRTSDVDTFAEAYKLFKGQPALLQTSTPSGPVVQRFGFLETEATARELAEDEEEAEGKETPSENEAG